MSASELFEPIKKAHAVAETIFFFEFAGRLIASSKKMDALKAALVHLLPIAEEKKSVEINIEGGDSHSIQHNADTIQLTKLNSSTDELQWLVRIMGPSLSIHCVEYHRWSPAKEYFLEILKATLSALDVKESLVGCGLKVLDRFRYNSELGGYDISKLLDSNSKYITKHAFSSGDRWHVYSGWFEKSTIPETEVLSQMNLDSSYVKADDSIQQYVTFDHTLSLRNAGSNVPKSALSAFDNSEKLLDIASDLFDELHVYNKAVVFDVLSKEVASRMNLGMGGAV